MQKIQHRLRGAVVGTSMVVGLLATPLTAFAGNVTFTADTDLSVPGSGIALVVLTGSNADSVVLDTNTVTVTVSGGDTLQLQNPLNGRLENDKGLNACTKVGGIVTLTVTAADSPVIFTPSATICSSGGGSSSGPSTIPSTTPTIDLTAPSGTVNAGSTVNVTWTFGGQGIQTVNLSYSTNTGISFTTIVDNAPKDVPFSWTIPASLSGSVILRATGRDSGGGDTAIDQTTLTVVGQDGTVTQPAAGALDADRGITRNADGNREAPPSGVIGLSPLTGLPQSVSEVHPGQFVRGHGFPGVYLVTDTMTRRPFWGAITYFTWAASFDEIVWVTDATLATLPMGTPMLPKPGVVLVKIQSDARTYEVEIDTDGAYLLRHIVSEAVAIARYGTDWADFVIDLEPTMLSRYRPGPDQILMALLPRNVMKGYFELARLAAGGRAN